MKFNRLGTTGLVASMALLAACATTDEDVVEVIETEPEIVEPVMSELDRAKMELEQNVGNRVFFGYDAYNLTADAQTVLRRQASFLTMPENMDIRVRVAGNCDERGTREYNLALGERRAEAAKAYLVSLGVAPTRISTVSYGKERPLDPASNPQAWAKNRNATTTIVETDMDMM
ncbi:peptidoglycan-associated lipoprotein Pal [Parvularcula sp. ZS-1/3]|uniref:Peptidoglycan-associated lipoprotein n=1 Tax=Parvularcula mediterranea TaxID=2732508 RepID=A0A7Y3W626_9PROT|nr:peptidoglycan-associated lipoprotein Pal [Parvularcula mediterranea]NNU16927.1 peptidoglycan-associated lipoprotein Pal [Parvularcula mediterranea]